MLVGPLIRFQQKDQIFETSSCELLLVRSFPQWQKPEALGVSVCIKFRGKPLQRFVVAHLHHAMAFSAESLFFPCLQHPLGSFLDIFSNSRLSGFLCIFFTVVRRCAQCFVCVVSRRPLLTVCFFAWTRNSGQQNVAHGMSLALHPSDLSCSFSKWHQTPMLATNKFAAQHSSRRGTLMVPQLIRLMNNQHRVNFSTCQYTNSHFKIFINFPWDFPQLLGEFWPCPHPPRRSSFGEAMAHFGAGMPKAGSSTGSTSSIKLRGRRDGWGKKHVVYPLDIYGYLYMNG